MTKAVRFLRFSSLSLVLSAVVTFVAAAQSPSLPLVSSGDLVYEGAFRLPAGDFGSPQHSGFNWGGTALAFDSDNDSLFIVGHGHHQLTAEVSIPSIVNSTSLADLSTATVVQGFSDATEGRRTDVDPPPAGTEAVNIGGHYVSNGRLYTSAYSYYDGDMSQVTSHFGSSSDLSVTGDTQGPYQVGTVGAGFVSGYMIDIPQSWQSAFGASAITGQCCLAIIQRSSLGPAAFAFEPGDIGTVNPVPATPLLYYDMAHPTLGAWDAGGLANYYNGTAFYTGAAFPDGTSTVLFFGTRGTGTFCYGTGAACNDPEIPDQGTHAYPYVYQVLAYDANELEAVAKGQQAPWDVVPYEAWTMNLLPAGTTQIGGAAYDRSTDRIFVSQMYADGAMPIIHVYKVTVSGQPIIGSFTATPVP